MGKRPNIFQTFIQESRFDKLMNYFDDDDTRPFLMMMNQNQKT